MGERGAGPKNVLKFMIAAPSGRDSCGDFVVGVVMQLYGPTKNSQPSVVCVRARKNSRLSGMSRDVGRFVVVQFQSDGSEAGRDVL